MKKVALLSLFVMLSAALAIGVPCPIFTYNNVNYPCLFYGGDFDPNNPFSNGLTNETDVMVPTVVLNPDYGAATFQNFIVGRGGITAVGLFSNNLSTLTPASGYWEVRSGLSEGNSGALVASGSASGNNFAQVATGRTGFGITEYTDVALGLNLSLAPGMYWFAVVPNAPSQDGFSYNSNTFGLNSIGSQISDLQFFNSRRFHTYFTNADNEGVYPTFSSGVLGIEVPEPGSLIMLGSGLVAAAGVARNRLRRKQ